MTEVKDTADRIKALFAALSPGESKALDDRLGQPDCLGEALAPDPDGDPPFDGFAPEDTEVVAGHLLLLDVDAACDINPRLAVAVLVDCVEGSTWAACATQEPSTIYAACCRQLYGLRDKMQRHLGVEIKRLPIE